MESVRIVPFKNSTARGFCWKISQVGPFGNTTRGFECKALQSESFGKRYERIRLGSLRPGTLWTTLPRVSTGMPHTRNMLVSSPSGFCSKASQQAPCGKRYKGILWESLIIVIPWVTLQTDPIRNPRTWNPLDSTAKMSV